MSDSANNQNLSKVCEESEFTWVLHKFSDISEKYGNGSYVESPIFAEENRQYKWKLQFYPNGVDGNEDNVAVFLQLTVKLCGNVPTDYDLILQNLNDDIIAQKRLKNTFQNNSSWGCRNFANREDLISSISADGIFKIRVAISAEVLTLQSYHTLNETEERSQPNKLSRELGIMFKSNEFSDFTIKLNDGSEIPVYRGILAARSPVFSAMFKHSTSERELAYTTITDVDKDTMLNLLYFIYTGEVNTLSRDKMEKLLAAAEKYELTDLKKMCTKTLIPKIKVSNALDMLLLSELCNVFELKQAALDYIFANYWKFLDTSHFKKLERYPNLLSEIVTKSFNLRLSETNNKPT